MRAELREKWVYPAITGALYAALTMLLAPVSYGALQFRLSEALCVLPFFLPYTSVGLFLGCAIANTLSAAGILDIVFGSLATLGAALCTAALGRKARRGEKATFPVRIAACMSPVLWNGVIVGAVLALSFTPGEFRGGFWLFGGQVALGELGVMLLLGLPLLSLLPRALRLPTDTKGSGT